ncbi:dihydrolipoyl dehydrogenase [Paraburkholderia xenovorans LB400]|uniref:Dihydrolipoyl dehydrogenase n=1 Tax=Paraburkholderia xenovorans (strain LB400) TaxID=266265 RepID=Q13GQ7_PARXL|nr:dihydrolipoyl dehydrogenase [Paraburkholderia xenovorans]ABE36732.1 dihydrolipoamide dehydrogenase [Paraburkholderia xenovorans LB400]AIP34847.1 dihydrolipoyl dehydrogenase [Paraburkholderia xenovorans LB400]
MDDHYDVIVIGGGPGGYVAALRAAQLGRRTALCERDQLGGICLNWGCIPTKALLHTADTLRTVRKAAHLGIGIDDPVVDFTRVMARSREVAQKLNRGVSHLLRKAGVTVLAGTAAFAADRSVRVHGADGALRTLQARHTIVATGAAARQLPALPWDGERIWTYREALAATAVPKSLLVVGAGAIGMEFAGFYAAMGTEVTVVEVAPRILPASDADVSEFVARACERDGIRLRTGCSVVHSAAHAEGVRVMFRSENAEEQREFERVLVAVGLDGNTEGLGLEHTRVAFERGLIIADAAGATSDPVVHAVGDVTGAPMLAHKASHQAIACVERIAEVNRGERHASPKIPGCVYSHPQTASVGLTEDEARRTGRALRVGRFPLDANGKAIALGDPSGFVKTIFDAASGELLGAHIVGPEAPELIHGFTLAATLEATESELIETVFPHPTLSEAMHESVLAAFGRPLHI